MTPEEFWDRTTPEPNTGCWIWICSAEKNQYGVATVNGYEQGPHRWVYELATGDFLTDHTYPKPWRIKYEGPYVLHRCDNKWCVNPDHLFKGTPSDNMADHWSKVKRGIKRLKPRKPTRKREPLW